MRRVVDAFHDGGGSAKPMILQVALSCAPTDAESVSAAYDQWRQCALPHALLANMASPSDFDRGSDAIKLEDVLQRVRASSDIERHIDWLRQDSELGFERIYLHNVARDHQGAFIDICRSRLLPAFAETTSTAAVTSIPSLQP